MVLIALCCYLCSSKQLSTVFIDVYSNKSLHKAKYSECSPFPTENIVFIRKPHKIGQIEENKRVSSVIHLIEQQ